MSQAFETTGGEFIVVPDCTISVNGSSCNYIFFCLLCTSFAFSFHFMASPWQDGMPRNRSKKKILENATKKESFAWTAVHRSCKVREYLNRLWISVHKKTFSRTKIDHTNSNYLLRYVCNYVGFNVGNKKFEKKF